MRANIFLLKVTFLITSLSCADNKPVIEFQDTVIDTGTIQPGDSLNLEFKFINSGRGSLIIKNVGTSCYCANAEYSNQPVSPDSSGSIRVLFVSRENVGLFEEPVIVQSNTDPQLTVLKITGIIENSKSDNYKGL